MTGIGGWLYDGPGGSTVEPDVHDFCDIITHRCGYTLVLHVFISCVPTDILNSWKYAEIIYTDYADEHGEAITYCPKCGEYFTVQGRIEKNGGSKQ
jgi:hypothetical protein